MVQNDEMEVIVTIYIYFYDMGHYNTIGIYVRNAFMFDRKKINYN